MVTNPLDNSTLQGRFDSYPIRRGHTRFKELVGGWRQRRHRARFGGSTPGIRSATATRFSAPRSWLTTARCPATTRFSTLFDMIGANGARALGIEGYGL